MKADLRQKWIAGTAAVFLIGGIAVTGLMLKEGESDQIDSKAATTSVQTSVTSVKTNAVPKLEAEIVQEGRDATITYEVENFNISAEHIDKDPIQGMGHLHIYVDGKQKGILKTDAPVKLENLSPGKHTIKLDLQHNNHTPLKVEKVFEITVK